MKNVLRKILKGMSSVSKFLWDNWVLIGAILFIIFALTDINNFDKSRIELLIAIGLVVLSGIDKLQDTLEDLIDLNLKNVDISIEQTNIIGRLVEKIKVVDNKEDK